MPRLDTTTAPDFTLDDVQGQPVSLADFRGEKNVVLVFNRGFMWPYCRRHMAQLRQDYQQFVERDAEIVVVGPEDRKSFASQWAKEQYPFVGLADPEHTVADRYGQEVKLLKFGRMPAIMVIDKQGQVLDSHYADNMRDYPANSDLLALLDTANATVTP